MGLLTALDFHKPSQSGIEGKSIEVEYRLHSWGEIYPPFIGDREHSMAARFILRDFPFKLFSSSTPYDDPLPQKLCLTFKAPYEEKKKTNPTHITIGFFPDEIAKEFAAFLTLVTRRRIFVDRQTRQEGLPIEQKTEIYEQVHFQERQRLKEIDPTEIYQLLNSLRAMERSVAESFVLAMRLYHSAVEMMYTEPEFSYLFLILCLEAISSAVNKNYTPEDIDRFLNSKFHGWDKDLAVEKKESLRNVLMRSQHFTSQKFRKFIVENTPERFWSEKEDDAKPDYLTCIIKPGPDGLGQEHFSSSDKTIQEWEKIEKTNFKKVLSKIYDVRSSLVHEGIRLPANITIGHFRKIPSEAFHELMSTPKIPPLLTFERLVSYSLIEFLKASASGERTHSS